MSSYFSGKISYYYYGNRYSHRSQPVNFINVIKVFILKIMMATFFCAGLYLIQHPTALSTKSFSLGVAGSCIVMGLGFLYLVNRKLIRMKI